MRILSVLAALALWSSAARAGDFSFAIGEAEAVTGGRFSLAVFADAPVPYQGFSFTVRYPAAAMEVERIGVEGTILEAIGADFVHGEAFPALGIFTVGVLVDSLPPFDGTEAPAPGIPLEVARVTGRALLDSPGEIPLEFSDSVERPAAPNVFSVENRSVPARALIPGRVRVRGPAQVPAFIRGDVNRDRGIDISDVVAILAWRFLGASGPRCEAAADANADGGLDVSDGIHLLLFLFLDGPRPLPPQHVPGPDPLRSAPLHCAEPPEWIASRAR